MVSKGKQGEERGSLATVVYLGLAELYSEP